MNTCSTALEMDKEYKELIRIFRNGHSRKVYDPLNKEITNILFKLGIKSSLKGFKLLRTAIKMAVTDDSYLDVMTKVFYPDIAKEHQTTSDRVERSIRHAIKSIDRDNKFLLEIFPDERKEFSNKEFISSIVEYMNVNCEGSLN